jgi:predicted HAD superfamily Cof-like phosphohydrolase
MAPSNFSDVGDFHEKFGLHRVWASSGPTPHDPELMDFRAKFLEEELIEFREGLAEQNHEKMFDALLDLVYVAMGTAHLLGYPWQSGWNLVQEANMAKMRATSAEESQANTGRGSSFDVIKPPGWTPPDIEGLLESLGYPGCGDNK